MLAIHTVGGNPPQRIANTRHPPAAGAQGSGSRDLGVWTDGWSSWPPEDIELLMWYRVCSRKVSGVCVSWRAVFGGAVSAQLLRHLVNTWS